MWRSTKLKYEADVTLGKMLQSDAKSPDDTQLPYARAASIGQDGRLVTAESKTMWFSPSERESLSLLSGDVLVVEGGDAGRSVILLEDQPGWGFQNSVNRVRAANRNDPRFLAYFLSSARESGLLRAYCDVVSIPHLTAEKLKRVPLALPSSDAQRSIADFLDRETAQIDTLIAKQEQLIVTLRERRSAVAADLIWNRQTSSTDEPPSDIWSSTPGHWRRLRNKHVLRERTELSESGAEELLSISHLTGVTPRSEKNVTMFEAESLAGYKRVYPGDLVINTMWAWMGALGVTPIEGIVSPAYGVYAATVGVEFDPRFFNAVYTSRAYVDLMTVHSRGMWSSRLRLYPDVFLSLPIVVPPLVEQTMIATEIQEQTSRIDTLIAKTQQFIALARERRSALITAAVTGQIDVKAAA